MLRPQNYAIPGYVRDGYCAPWSPLYVRDGYVQPGYVRTTPSAVNHPLMSFDLARLPGYPEYTLDFNQWAKESGGGARTVGEPYAVRLFITLSWPSLCTADRDNLETFFRTIARAQSERWVWYNPIHGNALPVRFADADFPETPEIGLGYHRLDGLRLMVDVNFTGQLPTGPPNYPAGMGTAFAIGGALMQFPPPVRPGTGYGVSTRHAREDSSAGEAVVYRTGDSVRRVWSLSWTNLRYIHWLRLQALFCTFARGQANPIDWYDGPVGEEDTVNLIANPSFESALGVIWPAPNTVYEQSAVRALSGSKSLHITAIGPSSNVFFTQEVAAAAVYTASIWVYGVASSRMELAIWDQSNGGYLGTPAFTAVLGAWTRLVVTFTTPPGCVSIYFFIRPNYGHTEPSDTYWDAVQLEQKDHATSFVDGARTSPAPTIRTMRLASSRITIKQLGYDRFTCTLPLLEEL